MTSSPPSSSYPGSLPRVPGQNCWLLRIGAALVAGLNPTSHDIRADDTCTTCHHCPEEKVHYILCQVDVKTWCSSSRCFELNHTAHRLCGSLVTFEFHFVNRTSQVEYFYCVCCGTEEQCSPTPSIHRLRRGLPGYLILFAPPRSSLSVVIVQ